MLLYNFAKVGNHSTYAHETAMKLLRIGENQRSQLVSSTSTKMQYIKTYYVQNTLRKRTNSEISHVSRDLNLLQHYVKTAKVIRLFLKASVMAILQKREVCLMMFV